MNEKQKEDLKVLVNLKIEKCNSNLITLMKCNEGSQTSKSQKDFQKLSYLEIENLQNNIGLLKNLLAKISDDNFGKCNKCNKEIKPQYIILTYNYDICSDCA